MWIHFILNDKSIATDLPPGMVLLDFIRYHEHLTGTKIGCREGDCGACTILIGEIKEKVQHNVDSAPLALWFPLPASAWRIRSRHLLLPLLTETSAGVPAINPLKEPPGALPV